MATKTARKQRITRGFVHRNLILKDSYLCSTDLVRMRWEVAISAEWNLGQSRLPLVEMGPTMRFLSDYVHFQDVVLLSGCLISLNL